MGSVPSSAIPTLVKGLSRLNDDGDIILNRDTLAMLAAVDGQTTVQDIARVHGEARTNNGLSHLLLLGAVRLENDSERGPSGPSTRTSEDPLDSNAPDWSRETEHRASSRSTGVAFLWRWAMLASPAVAIIGVVVVIGNPLRWSASDSAVPETRIELADPKVIATSQTAQLPVTPAATCDGMAPCSALVEATASVGYAPSTIAPTMRSAASAGPATIAQATAPGLPIATIQPTIAASHGKTPEAPISTLSTPVALPTATVSAATAALTSSPEVRAALSAPEASAAPRTLLDERFAENGRGWPNDPSSSAWLTSGGYRLFARQPGRFVAVGAPGITRVRDVSLNATFRKVGGPPGGGYGFVVRDQGDGARDGINQRGRFYVLEVGDRGEIGMWRREEDHWVDLVAWSPSAAVRPGGEPNEIALRVTGERFVFLVNGVEVINQADGAFAEGAVGVFVGGDGNEVVLESLKVDALR